MLLLGRALISSLVIAALHFRHCRTSILTFPLPPTRCHSRAGGKPLQRATTFDRPITVSPFILDDFNLPQISPFPGKKRDFTFYVGVLIDTSGSQSKEDIIDALSGCKSIIEHDKHCKVVVIENDTKVQKEYEIKRLSDIQMNVRGRGGTILMPGLERLKQLNVDVTLGFTDGYCEDLNSVSRKKLPKKIIWAVRKEHGTVSTLNRTGFIVRI